MRDAIAEALRLLDKRRFVLQIHDVSFPSLPDEDIGHGASTTAGAAELLDFAAAQGFTGVLLGPQGAVSAMNPSPYDGTVLSRSPLTIPPRLLVEDGLVDAETLARLVAGRPVAASVHADPVYAHGAMTQLLDEACAALARSPDVRAYAARNSWLEADAVYDVLDRMHGGGHFGAWPGALDRRLFAPRADEEHATARRLADLRVAAANEIARYAAVQWIAEDYHTRLRAACARRGVLLYGDLQIGLSVVDVWTRAALLLPGYRMGAPPSRTNVEGQPWGYAVLDPQQYRDVGDRPGPALRFVEQRMDRMLSLYDGVRIDHPHGHSDPWVYDAGAADPLRAVQNGARLFSSPDLPDHPALAAFAVARPAQIDRGKHRFDDGWVTELDDEQVARYAVVIDVIVDTARRRGRALDDLLCEVLSTLPYPLARVMERHGFGRFRVTQKASLVDPTDVYRAENAQAADWVMIGNHDTPPVWRLLEDWARSGALAARRDLLAGALRVDPRSLAAPSSVAQAMLAELFLSPARNVMVFFADLFGLTEIYNEPGIVSGRNWRLRLAPGWRARYDADRRRGRVLDVPAALAAALRAKRVGTPALIDRLLGRDGPAGPR
ncbi:MAG TPA: 4-alpha-glucanotransferase [Candidatus Methylomirabilis sp.]|nr:4-alpha-glucanotransferase [Candidatus Methylomirabilis sp.]